VNTALAGRAEPVDAPIRGLDGLGWALLFCISPEEAGPSGTGPADHRPAEEAPSSNR